VLRVTFRQCFSLRHRSVLGFEMQGPAREQLARIDLLARQAKPSVYLSCVQRIASVHLFGIPFWYPSI
jgi:hypothetical protein